jgi:predicted XRE-type DNA-binding protein
VCERLLTTEIDQAVVLAHHLQVERPRFTELVNERLDYFERKSASIKEGN